MKKYTKKQQKYIDNLLATIDGQAVVIDALEDVAITVPVMAMELVHAATASELLQSENDNLRTAVNALAVVV